MIKTKIGKLLCLKRIHGYKLLEKEVTRKGSVLEKAPVRVGPCSRKSAASLGG